MKIAVYTCITNGYDQLKSYPSQFSDIDFICFTDNANMFFCDTKWIIKNIPEELNDFSKIKRQRLLKVLSHRFLKEYDITLWIDGNIRIIGQINNFIKKYNLGEIGFYTRKHPSRKCIYEEAEAVEKLRKDTHLNIYKQIDRYKAEGFPKNFGLEETNIILRNNRNIKTNTLCNLWAKEIIENSHRDQLSFDYCRWKSNTEIGFLDISFRKGDFFRLERHNG